MTGMFWKSSIWALFALVLSSCSEREAGRDVKGLVSAQQLQSLLDANAAVQLIDVRPEADFLTGHLPGAINIWRTDIQRTDTAYNGLRIPLRELEVVLGDKGVAPDHRLILYDAKGCVDAARLWWLLRCYGHDEVALLDGGLTAWDGALSKSQVSLPKQHFVFEDSSRSNWIVDYPDFERLRQSSGVVLIDSRSDPEFAGEEQKKGAFMAGHVPGAVQYDYVHALDYSAEGQQRFKASDALRAAYADLASASDTVIVYCHSGVRSSHTLFVLTELLGYSHVKNYDGSWVEWSYFHRQAPTDSLNISQL